MIRWSVHALVSLCTVICLGTVNGTYLGPLLGTNVDGNRRPLIDQITALIEKINKQEGRLQTLETQLADHAVALAEKDKRIDHLEQELDYMKWRAASSDTPSQQMSSTDRNKGAKHHFDPEIKQSDIDSHISDQYQRDLINHNGTTQRKPAQNYRIRSTDQRNDLNNENDVIGEETASLDVRFKRTLNNLKANDPDVNTAFGQPLMMKQQEKRVDNASPERYAFSLSLSSNTNVVQGEIINYDNVMLDLGNGYSHGNGIYEVPASGVYVFTWSTTSGINNGGLLYTELVVNGVVQLPIDVDSDAHNYESATGLLLTSVNAGDHIYIRAMTTSQVISYEHGRSTFSGWRLF